MQSLWARPYLGLEPGLNPSIIFPFGDVPANSRPLGSNAFYVICHIAHMNNKAITVQTVVNAHMEKVWECWNKPEHITGWAFASDDWEAPAAENDLRVGGKFKTTMAAKDEREF